MANAIANVHQLIDSPSREDGVPELLEMQLKVLGCEMIQMAGILLRLPQVAIATAQVLLHRFYCNASLLDHGIMKIAMGAICLAAKLEEYPRKLKDVVNVFDYIRKKRSNASVEPLELFSEGYYEGKKMVAAAEMLILHALGFHVHVQHPHGMLMCYLNQMGLASKKHVTRQAWTYLNDSLRTNVCICYQPHTITCAVIYMAVLDFKINLTTIPPWYEVFDVSLEEIQNIAGRIMTMYQNPVSRSLPLTTSALRDYLSAADPNKER